MGNVAYAAYFDSLGLGVAEHLNVEHRAGIVEDFLALGRAYRTKPQDNHFPQPVTRHIPQIETNIIAFMEGPAIPTTAEEVRNTTQALRSLLQPVVGQPGPQAPPQQVNQMQQGIPNEMLRDLVIQAQMGLNQFANVVERELKAVKNDIAQILQEKEAEKVWAFNISPAISPEETKEVQDWAMAHWSQVATANTEQIKDLELPKVAAVLNAQGTAYNALKQGSVEMTDSGWAGYQALADHVRDPNYHGPVSDGELLAILAYTLDNHTQQPSYVMKTVTMDHQGAACVGLMVKTRDQAKPNARTGGYGDWGHARSKAGRYGGYKSQSYGSQ